MADDNTPAKTSTQLIEDLSTIPEIIGALGLSIAASQKAMDLNYLEGLERVIEMAGKLKKLNKNKKSKSDNILEHLILSLAPSRYQFTETSLSVRLDLAQNLSRGTTAGLGVNVGTVAVTAAMTSAFGYDYQAAAEVKTVLHAIPADSNVMKSLLSRATEKELKLPNRSDVDIELVKTAERIYKEIGNEENSAIDTGTDED